MVLIKNFSLLFISFIFNTFFESNVNIISFVCSRMFFIIFCLLAQHTYNLNYILFLSELFAFCSVTHIQTSNTMMSNIIHCFYPFNRIFSGLHVVKICSKIRYFSSLCSLLKFISFQYSFAK